MENFKNKGTAFPMVSLNGDSAKHLKEKAKKIAYLIEDAIDEIGSYEYDNGRNAISEEHRVEMREQKRQTILTLREVMNFYYRIIDGIQNQERNKKKK